MKKCLSILLVIVMLLTILPLGTLSISAATYTHDGMIYKIQHGEVTIIGYNFDLPSELVIPDTIDGYPVTAIGDYAFDYCEGLSSVVFGTAVKEFGMGIFRECGNLRSVTVSEDNPYFLCEDNVIYNKDKSMLILCCAYGEYVIPSSVTAYAEYAFMHSFNVTSITIPEGLTSIYCDMFAYCRNLEMVIIPDTVTNIDGSAFYGCVSLSSLIIPEGVKRIEAYAFSDCFTLTSIDIPDSVVYLSDYAFANSGLKVINIGAGVNNQLYFPDSMLEWINVSENNAVLSSVDGVLFNKDKTELLRFPWDWAKGDSYRIPDGVTRVTPFSFYCCSLSSLSIPESVTDVSDAFFDAHIKEITIPNSIRYMNQNIYGLSDVYYAGTPEEKEKMLLSSFLVDATWHYNCTNPKDLYSADVQHSVMDTENGNGLAFRFELSANGIKIKNGTEADLTDATINYLGTECKLIGMGAVVTNNDTIVDNLTLGVVNGINVLDIPTVYLQKVDEDSCAFATRIINIPDTQLGRIIYARPYYIVEVDGQQITVYGDVDSATCAEYL